MKTNGKAIHNIMKKLKQIFCIVLEQNLLPTFKKNDYGKRQTKISLEELGHYHLLDDYRCYPSCHVQIQ